MAALELDPLLKRGLKLLHSRNRDSADQLRALIDEAVLQRQGKNIPSTKDPFSLRRESPIPRSKQNSPLSTTFSKTDLKRDFATKDDSFHPNKKPKLDSPHTAFSSHTPSPTPSLKSESSSRSRKSDESDSDADMRNIAMENDIACTVCKTFEWTPGNTLVECMECHALYHQECHKPHVTIMDPKEVWYCAKCHRNMKKQSSLISSSGGTPLGSTRSSTASSVSSGSTKGPSSSSSSKGSTSSRPTSSSPSKSMSLHKSSPFANLASATNRGSSSSSSTVSSVGSRSGLSNSTGNRNTAGSSAANSMLSAERRVHLMKKKAAAKHAERRKIM